MTVYDLSEQRAATLARVRASIEEMQHVLANTPSGSPSAVMVGQIIKRLRATEARLAPVVRRVKPVKAR